MNKPQSLFGSSAPEIDFGEDFEPMLPGEDETDSGDSDIFASIAAGVFDEQATPESRSGALREAILHLLGSER